LLSSCTNCPLGSYCTGGSALVSCPAGRYGAGSGLTSEVSCLICPLGSYCTGGTSTVICPSGYYGASTGLIAPEGCTICPSGSYCTGGVATVCPPGSYASTTGRSSCVTCPVGSYCPGGRWASTCIACTYGDTTGLSSCKDCPAGKYCGGGSSIVTCAEGTYSLSTRAMSVDTCLTCPAGSQCSGGMLRPCTASMNQYSNSGQSSCDIIGDLYYLLPNGGSVCGGNDISEWDGNSWTIYPPWRFGLTPEECMQKCSENQWCATVYWVSPDLHPPRGFCYLKDTCQAGFYTTPGDWSGTSRLLRVKCRSCSTATP